MSNELPITKEMAMVIIGGLAWAESEACAPVQILSIDVQDTAIRTIVNFILDRYPELADEFSYYSYVDDFIAMRKLGAR